MRVLHINAGNEDGGARTYIVNLMKGQKLIGEESALLTFQEGPVSKMARENGLKVAVLPQRQRFDLSILKPLVQYINNNDFDIVHTHGPRANYLVSLIRKKIHAKWVITVHSDPRIDFSGLKGSVMLKLNLHALKRANLLFYINPDMEEYFDELKIDHKKRFEVFNAIDFAGTNPVFNHQPTFTILEVARLVEVKNHRLLLEALSKVSFNFRLVLVGDGPLMDQLHKLTVELGINDKVEFVGFKENTGEYYQECDVSILTSKTESMPAVYLESAAYGKPVIATNVGATDKVIDNENGWLVESNNEQELIQALNDAHEYWKDDNLSQKGMALYQEVRDNYSIEALAHKVNDGYQATLKAN
ncbi:glycosyltransferase [Companilactobacillus suantsaicola]|uniref:Glycosyltransferase n=1 Tax=Companilactobacillus suantsaicola TaxID=2487723 RepID=A0A4Z0JND5_9LACO|nr:glycosyltransferase [Companilactobacillus suantsaicola]TGD24467.1 glycosyltransferase [Companilactobacillus suantsaicola]